MKRNLTEGQEIVNFALAGVGARVKYIEGDAMNGDLRRVETPRCLGFGIDEGYSGTFVTLRLSPLLYLSHPVIHINPPFSVDDNVNHPSYFFNRCTD